MRFYFQDRGQKVATKCIRVASDATVTDVIGMYGLHLLQSISKTIRCLFSQFLMKKKKTTTSLSRLCRNTNREIPAGHANVIGAKLCAL